MGCDLARVHCDSGNAIADEHAVDARGASPMWKPPGEATRPEARIHGRTGRATHRALGAAIIAGGLAISVSVHPSPSGPRVVDLFTPDQSSTGAPAVTWSKLLKATRANFLALELPDLLTLVEIREQHPYVTADELYGLMTHYGIRNVVDSLEFLASVGSVQFGAERIPYGGGGGGPAVEEPLLALRILLQFLEHNPPHLPVPFAVLAKVVAELADSLGFIPGPSVSIAGPLAAQLAVLVPIVDELASPPSTLASGPLEAPDWGPADFRGAAVDTPAPAPVELRAIQPVETRIPMPTAVPNPLSDVATPPSSEPTSHSAEPSTPAAPEHYTTDGKPQDTDPPASSGSASTGSPGAGDSAPAGPGGGSTSEAGGSDSDGGDPGGSDQGSGDSGGSDSGGGSSGSE